MVLTKFTEEMCEKEAGRNFSILVNACHPHGDFPDSLSFDVPELSPEDISDYLPQRCSCNNKGL